MAVMALDRTRIERILQYREQRRPRHWIARETGVRYLDVCTVVRVAGDTTRDGATLTLARYDALNNAVEDGWSLSEIRRTLGFDSRTVRRWFPDYRPFPVGGAGEAAEIRETNRRLNEFIRRGKVQSNRDAGFNQRSDVL